LSDEAQTSLDIFLSHEDDVKGGNGVIGDEVGENVVLENCVDVSEATLKENMCPCFMGMPTRLHVGAMYVFMHTDPPTVLADIDHVYYKCRNGLVFNIKALVDIARSVESINMGKVLVIGKAYDDDLYLYLTKDGRGDVGKVRELLLREGFTDVLVGKISHDAIAGFIEREWYLQVVDGETVVQALAKP